MIPIEVERIELRRAGGPIPRQGNARTTWERRDAVVVALRDRAGRVGLGEAAPLPGFADEEVDLDALVRGEATTPAARFALELADLDLRGQRESKPASRLIDADAGDAIEVSALLGDPRDEGAVDRARRLVAAGARTLKLKLGAGVLDDDVAAVRSLRHALGPEVALIGDANGAWTVEHARAALDRLAPCRFDYVEQPVSPDDLLRLGPVSIPVWADESLVDPSRRAGILAAHDVAGVVCKPTVLGGIAACLDLARRARDLGKGVVVTHALEGPVAMAGCAALALGVAAVAPRAGIWPHEAGAAFPEVALPGFCGGTLVATERSGIGLTDAERARILALPVLTSFP